MKKVCFIIFTAILFIGCSQKQNDSDKSFIINEDTKTRIDSTLKNLVDDGSIAGVSALIFEKDKEVYFNAFGFADREGNVKMDRSTIVRIYSMTKPVTGVALMQLHEQGRFQLDEPLSKYCPEFANTKVFSGYDENGEMILVEPNRPVTIRDITRHTAGFVTNQPDTTTRLGMLVKKTNAMSRENTLQLMAQKLGSLPLLFHPGEQWAYGPAVDVQACLVERLSGKTFDQYVRESILGPLQMNTTRYYVSEENRSRFSAVYRKTEDGSLVKLSDEDANSFNTRRWPLTPGGYGLTSTLDDYMRFARMLVKNGTLEGVSILKPETIKLMATNHLADSVTERMWLPSKGQVGFGIDFAVRISPPASEQENNGVVGEFFWDGAASTLFWVDPVNELTAVLFVQIFPFDRNLHKKFRDAVYGSYLQKPEP